MRLLLFINSLSSGGAERVMAKLADHLVAQNHAVNVVTQVSLGADHYPTRARRLSLDAGTPSTSAWHALSNNFKRWRRLRRVIRQTTPDCVIAFMPTANTLALLATLGSRIPVIVSERVHPPFVVLSPLRQWLQRRLYPSARAIVVLSRDSETWLRTHQHLERLTVIPNAVSLPLADNEPRVDVATAIAPDKKLILAVGRIVEQKQHEVVLRAFAGAATDPCWHLAIIGDGPGAAALIELAARLGITERFCLLPRVGNIQAWYERAAIYISASRYEGFPNALLEAMACRCAAVVYDCPTGPADIIEHRVNGLLVPLDDEARLCQALTSLVEDAQLRDRLAANATSIVDRYSHASFCSSWDAVIQAAANN